MVADGAFSNKIDYVPIFQENQNLKGHLNCFICSKVTAILVNRGILPRGGVASGSVCPAACAAGLFWNTWIECLLYMRSWFLESLPFHLDFFNLKLPLKIRKGCTIKGLI